MSHRFQMDRRFPAEEKTHRSHSVKLGLSGSSIGHSGEVVQIRLQGDGYSDSDPMGLSGSDVFGSIVPAGTPYYVDSGVGAAMGLGSGMITFEDEVASSGLDSNELVQLLGGSQAIAQLSDAQLEELGRAQFTVVDPRADSEMANCPLSLSVEEDDRPLDEAEILRVSHCSSLERVKILSVPACGYTSINATDLSRCVNLRQLDLSENALRVFPRRLHLPRLRQLSLTGNRFIHLPLVEQFPQLTRLNIDDKLKQLLNPQMLSHFCPKLKVINGQYFDEFPSEFTVRIVQEARVIFEPHIRSKWESDFADHCHTVRNREERMQIIEHMVQHLRERNVLMDETLSKYKDLMLFQFVEEYLRSKLLDASEADLFSGSERHGNEDTSHFTPDDLLADSTTSGQEPVKLESATLTTAVHPPSVSAADAEPEKAVDDDEEEKEAELRATSERALFEAVDELLGWNIPDAVTLAQAAGHVETTLFMDSMGRLHQQQVTVAPGSGYQTIVNPWNEQQQVIQSNQIHLGRSLRQGRSIVMTVVRPRGVSGRPVAEFLPGELRNKDYVKGYMASEIYKKAVKDTLGQKSTPKKRLASGRLRRGDQNVATGADKQWSGANAPLGEVNSENGSKKSVAGIATSRALAGRHQRDYEAGDQHHGLGGSNLPPRPKKRKALGGQKSLRDLCSDSFSADSFANANTGGPRSDATPIDYDPLHFIRCHAKDNDAGDSETKVWRCLFEPNPVRPEETTHVVATCGGECVCLINCETGKVMKRFKHMEEEFYTIAWTTVEVENGKCTNILAAAGRMREIRLLHPEQLVCYAEMKGHTEDITAMIFHQTQSTILFSGDSKASVIVWDIGVPSVPDYKTRYQLLMRLRCPRLDVNPVLNLVFLPHYAYLIAGCEDGLFAWKITDLRLEKREREPDMELKLDFDHEVCIDALAQLSDNALVIKVVESGEIMVFDFASVLERRKGLQRIVPIEMRGHLLWQKTDEIYINVSVRQNLGAVLCGDNEGSIWIYDLDPYLDDLHASSRKKFHVKPIKILEWPECSVQGNRDEDQQLKESITSGFRNPVVNSVEMSSDGYYLAAVTDNNLVCIWRYAPPQQHPQVQQIISGQSISQLVSQEQQQTAPPTSVVSATTDVSAPISDNLTRSIDSILSAETVPASRNSEMNAINMAGTQ
ncbi:unnamed protein product [Calicophoron daubneyi]|uniref:Leucine-rich repeat and WD repeat-containing protein 1 WD domain-containing protein n=1 Tax=Calicophoron daubneyi TaxID=300641 RepID=A0AAV2TY88_CALDB